ncbi:MAG: CRISPR-associated endonuclease Cas2 [Paracoccaceae bacterium]
MEELRATLAGRLAMSLVKLRQLRADDFRQIEGGAVLLSDDARRTILTAWQDRKKEERLHPFLAEKPPFAWSPFCRRRCWRATCAALSTPFPLGSGADMLVLVTYDVSPLVEGGKKRLRRVARACEDFGQRVQFSVLDIEVDPA